MARAYFRLFFDQYIPLVEALNDEERGRLFWGMMKYAQYEISPKLPGNERFVWPFIKEDIDRDKLAYIRKCNTNAANGRKGGLKKQQNLANATQAKEANESNKADQAEQAEQANESDYAKERNQQEAESGCPVRPGPDATREERIDFNKRFTEYVRSLMTPQDYDWDYICAEAEKDEAWMDAHYGRRC